MATAFWTHQLEEELRECGVDDYLFDDSSSQKDCMDKIDCKRAKTGYAHETVVRNAGGEVYKETVKSTCTFIHTLPSYFSHVM